MEFPFTPTTNLGHRWGGKIQKVHGICHQAVKPQDGRSLDGWWFDCDVLWDDTGKVARSPVEPFKFVADDPGKNQDLQALTAELGKYLAEHGEWDGKYEGWYAHDRKVRRAA